MKMRWLKVFVLDIDHTPVDHFGTSILFSVKDTDHLMCTVHVLIMKIIKHYYIYSKNRSDIYTCCKFFFFFYLLYVRCSGR